MKKTIYLICITLMLGLQGCFEVIEEVNLNSDGSGLLTLTINASQSKSNLDNVMSKDSIGGFKVPHRKDIETAIGDVSTKLKSIKGISNVLITRDFSNYILVVKCNFANTTALNAAVNNIWLLYDKKAQMNKTYFSYSDKTFKRSFDFSLIKNLNSKLGAQEKDILSQATYTNIYRLPSEIVSFTNSGAIPSKSKKAIILKNTVLNIVNGKKSIENEIKLK